MNKSNLFKAIIAASIALSSVSFSALTLSDRATASDNIVQAKTYYNGTKQSLAPMIKRIIPTVVSIEIKGVRTTNQSDPTDIFRDLLPKEFQQFFGPSQGKQSQQTVRAQGSGVIIDAANGYVVTNNHVVDGAKTIVVKLSDNRQFNAKIVGTDPNTDLAVIKLEGASRLQQITLANSDNAEIGDFVVALGNPFGIGLTATQGIVSATNRSANINFYDNYIQTDAAINHGNSGGALVDLDGNLIGINTAILSSSGGSVGIGFAIPSNIVRSITSQLIRTGHVERGQIGISGSDLNQQLVDTLKIPVSEGAFISRVIEGSPAERAGLKAGDVVIKLDNTDIRDFNQFRAIIGSLPVGKQFRVTFIRDGKTYYADLKSEASKTINAQKKAIQDSQANKQVDSLYNLLGIKLQNNGNHIVVKEVNSNSPFAVQDVRSGDILETYQNQPIKSVEELNKLINSSKSEVHIFSFIRGNKRYFVSLTSNN